MCKPTATPMTDEQAKAMLQARLAELVSEDQMSSEGREPVTLQQDSVGRLSRMDAIQQQAMALATEKRRGAERMRVIAALQRIEEGEWGFCLTCGEEVAAARLRNDPSAVQCIYCASGGSGNAG